MNTSRNSREIPGENPESQKWGILTNEAEIEQEQILKICQLFRCQTSSLFCSTPIKCVFGPKILYPSYP